MIRNAVVPYTKYKLSGKYYTAGEVEIEYDALCDYGKRFYEVHKQLREKLQPIADASNMFVVVDHDNQNDEVIGFPMMLLPEKVYVKIKNLY